MQFIDYETIVDAYDDYAFHECCKLLYPHLGYRLLKVEDIRRIDLKERLIDIAIQRWSHRKEWNSSLSELKEYVKIIAFYMQEYLPCWNGSQPQNYKDRAIEIINDCNRTLWTLTDIEDVFVIYLSLIRERIDRLDNKGKPITTVDIGVKETDKEVLNEVYHFDFIDPAVKESKFRMSPDKYKHQSAKDKRYCYVISILLYCRLMQNTGTYPDKEDC